MLLRIFRIVVACACTFVLFQFVSLYMNWSKQVIFGSLTVLVAMAINRAGKSRLLTISLMLLSIAATLRYGWWRIRMVVGYFSDETNHHFTIDAVLMLILLSAEIYTVAIMVLGYMQTSQRLQRRPVPLPADESLWPHVDVLIPTYNEPLSLVRYTALAAINIDYPPEKLHVYILDDGSRQEFREFADLAGIGYVVREKHNHAKAGNINHALTKMSSPLVSIFDCDHVPTRSFLQMTVGWFLVEDKLAMMQTPHFFYSPDPFERNLLQYKSIPNEGELFYGIIQDGNDLWNATFFCGSCAVIRRKALEEVGGIAVETVTEDAHTSLRMQKKGWNTGYMNIAQAAGLATETLAGHVGQRVRWARGMIQILRTDNPLLAKGMKLTQRLCYFNAMMHFMYAVPRLIFLVAPLAYMLGGRTIIPGYWLAILAYALPHLIISNMTNSRVQGTHRHSFWNEIYETVLAPYILFPTVLALINPKLGSFNVTDKGTTLDETKFDRKIAAPTTWLLLLNFAGILFAPYRLLVLDPTHPGVVLSNLFWILFNVVILGVAAAVAHEQKQRRASVRIPVHIPVLGTTNAGVLVRGMTEDMSVGGASLTLSGDLPDLDPGEQIQLTFPVQTGDRSVTATVIRLASGKLRAQFNGLTIEEEETLTCALYSRADSWVSVRETVEPDRPFVSLGRIVILSFTGLKQVFLGLLPEKTTKRPAPVPARAVSVLVFALLSLATLRMGAQTAPLSMAPPAIVTPLSADLAPAIPASNLEPTRIRFKDMGVAGEAELRGPHSYYSLHFILPHTLLPRTATLNIGYRFSTELSQAATASIRVSLNKTLIATITPDTAAARVGRYNMLPVTVPADLLIRDNDLSLEFSGNGVLRTSGKAQAEVLARIANASDLVVSGAALPFRTDISLLPLPLFDSDLQGTTTIPFVFPTQPDAKTLQAAGIVASWFGILASNKPIRFRVVVGAVPPGNAVVFVNKSSGQAFFPATSQGASLQLSPNPSDPDGTALIVAGDNGDQLVQAARALSLRASHVDTGEQQQLLGNVLHVDDFNLPAARTIDDAPRWVPTDRLVSLSKYIPQEAEKTDGSRPVPVYFRVPPDLYYGETENLNLLIRYRYDAHAVAAGSALRTYINGTLINEAPLAPGERMTDGQRVSLMPVANMRPFTNTLMFNFDFAPARGAGTQLQGSILKNSSLDLRNLNHWAQLPNLELFANAGFPFTQLADLGRTVVMLPRRPSGSEITLYLDMLAHFSRQTGYPALRVEVAGPDDLVREDRDYLILGGFNTQPAFAALHDNLPIALDADGVHAKAMDTYLTRAQRWWYSLTRQQLPDQDFARDTGLADSVIEGIQSPYASDRSLVAVAMRDDSVEPMFADLFLERSQSSDISRTVSVQRGDHFLSYDLNVPRYHVGNISPYTAMRIWLTQYFWVLLVGVVFCTLVLGRWMRDFLQMRAEERLSASKNEAHAVV